MMVITKSVGLKWTVSLSRHWKERGCVTVHQNIDPANGFAPLLPGFREWWLMRFSRHEKSYDYEPIVFIRVIFGR